jgi:hypothetical protein
MIRKPVVELVSAIVASGLAMTLVSAGSVPSAGSVTQASMGARAAILDRFLAPQQQPLVSYRAFRRLSASTRGGRMQASIEAWTTLDPTEGFRYEVTAEEGPPVIRRRVLIAALEAERAVRPADAARAALTPENYDFLGIRDDEDNLMKLDVRPRRRHEMLVDGSLFVAGDSADLVRVEGELSRRPSFWTRKVRIVREYRRVEGVRVPVAMRSTADVLIVGPSSFVMTYRYTEINGMKVAEN